MVRPYAGDVLINNPRVDEVILDDPEGRDKGRSGFWRQVRELRRRRFDTALLLLPTERAVWMLFCAGIPRRVGVGIRLNQVLTFMQTVSRNKYIPLRHEADYCLDLGRKIGVRSDNLATEVFVTQEEKQRCRELLRSAELAGTDPIVCIHPGSGHSSPNWREERYAELAEAILSADRAIRIVVTGERIVQRFPDSPRLADVRGERSLRDLMGIIANADCVVSASTGPMHLAAAMKIPTVSLFCPLPACSPQLWGPLGNRSRTLLPPDGYCQGRCPGSPRQCTLEETDIHRVVAATLDTVKGRGISVT
jgi:ADP-heptose:LPS heptosyltransferase